MSRRPRRFTGPTLLIVSALSLTSFSHGPPAPGVAGLAAPPAERGAKIVALPTLADAAGGAGAAGAAGAAAKGPADQGGAVAPPLRVQAPAIALDSAVEPVALDSSGALDVPAPDRVGWYRASPRPGEAGGALLAAHVDSRRGPGVFARLAELAPGDEIVVTDAEGVDRRFRVRLVRQFPKDAFPVAQVYGATAQPVLWLVTCGGPFDRGARSYRDNVAVLADRTVVGVP